MLLEILTYAISPFPLSYFYLKSRIKGKKFVVRGKLHPPQFPPPTGKRLWLHGVSVGEVLSLVSIVRFFEKEGLDLVISTTTYTGMQVAMGKFREHRVFYFPLDLPHVVERFLDRLRPEAVIIAETELWPNFLLRAKKRGVKLFLVNGRISQRSFRWYKKLKGLMGRILSGFDALCVQNQDYYERFAELGAPEDRLFITGNMKADFEIRGEPPFTVKGPYMVAGSTMDLEEDRVILQAFAAVKNLAKLILAPRHPERAGESLSLAKDMGFRVVRRTEPWGEDWEVMVLDTMGELALMYKGSSLSIIGGSIRPYGGHNLLEPAFFASPVAFGPHMENFRDLAEEFLKEGAAVVFTDPGELSGIMKNALEGDLEQVGEKGRKILRRLRGATKRNAEIILSRL